MGDRSLHHRYRLTRSMVMEIKQMPNEAQEFFQELLYGEGAFLGLILILTIVILVTYKYKNAGIIFIPITLMMGLQYLANISTSSDFMWCAIIMFLAVPFLLLRMVDKA